MVSLLGLASCGEDEAAAEPVPAATASEAGARPAYGLVTPDQAAALATDPSVTVLDVRTPEEYAEGHLEGAVLVDFSAPTFADEIAGLDASQLYLVYCRSGNRSGQAVAVMQQAGLRSAVGHGRRRQLVDGGRVRPGVVSRTVHPGVR